MISILCIQRFSGWLSLKINFLTLVLQGAFTGKDVFQDVIPLCEKNFAVMKEVFSNPDQVMAKYVLNIFHLKLQVSVIQKFGNV